MGRIINDDSRDYPIEKQPVRTGPRVADQGLDNDQRAYDDGVMQRIAGPWISSRGDANGIPNAGAGPTFEGDTRTASPGKPQRFMPSGEGDRGHIVTDHGNPSGGPVMGYQNDESPSGVTRVGPNFLLGTTSGIAAPAQFNAPPADLRILKSARKAGIFKSAIFGDQNDAARGFLSERLAEREQLRKSLIATAKDAMSRAAYDEDENEDEDDQKSAAKEAVMTDDKDAKSAANMRRLHAQKTAGGALIDGVHVPTSKRKGMKLF